MPLILVNMWPEIMMREVRTIAIAHVQRD